jgi:hypothetical protein
MASWPRLAMWKRFASGSLAGPETPPTKFSMAFAGACYGWPYYCGVAWFVQKHRLLHEDARLYACSSGNVGGLYLATGIDAEKDGLEVCMAANEAHCHPRLGPWLRPGCAIRAYFEQWGPLLPDDAHVRANGRLHVLVTQLFPVMRRRVISHFSSKRALLSVMAASMSIPGHGVRLAYRDDDALGGLGYCLDGGILGTLHDDDRPGWPTVRVSVLPHASLRQRRPVHIAPTPGLTFRDLFTIRSREERRALHARGYEDAGRYFDRLLGQRADNEESVTVPRSWHASASRSRSR